MWVQLITAIAGVLLMYLQQRSARRAHQKIVAANKSAIRVTQIQLQSMATKLAPKANDDQP